MAEPTVPINEDRSSVWTYVVASPAERCTEATSEIVERCSEIFEAFDGFVVPLGTEYELHEYTRGALIPTGDGDPEERLRTQKVDIYREDPLSLDDILEPIDQKTSSDIYVPRIRIPRTRVKIQFDDRERYVDRNAHSSLCRASEKLDRQPNKDPLEIEIVHWPNREHPEIDEDFIFWIRVRTYTDLWFRGTELGQENGRDLGAFLKRLDTTLPVEKVQRHTDYDTVSLLEDIF